MGLDAKKINLATMSGFYKLGTRIKNWRKESKGHPMTHYPYVSQKEILMMLTTLINGKSGMKN